MSVAMVRRLKRESEQAQRDEQRKKKSSRLFSSWLLFGAARPLY